MVKKIKAGKSTNYYTRESNGNYILRDKSGHLKKVIKRGSLQARKVSKRAQSAKSTKKNSTKTTSSNTTSTTPTNNSSNTNSSETNETESTNTETVKEDLISNFTDAYKFAKKEFYKAKRDNGHILECKVIGSSKWKQGKWAYCYIPDYKIAGYMYITKASHEIDDDGKWLTSLTLQDYPPSLSSGESNDPSKTKDSSTDSSCEVGTSDDGTSTNSTDSTNSSTSSTSSTG